MPVVPLSKGRICVAARGSCARLLDRYVGFKSSTAGFGSRPGRLAADFRGKLAMIL